MDKIMISHQADDKMVPSLTNMMVRSKLSVLGLDVVAVIGWIREKMESVMRLPSLGVKRGGK